MVKGNDAYIFMCGIIYVVHDIFTHGPPIPEYVPTTTTTGRLTLLHRRCVGSLLSTLLQLDSSFVFPSPPLPSSSLFPLVLSCLVFCCLVSCWPFFFFFLRPVFVRHFRPFFSSFCCSGSRQGRAGRAQGQAQGVCHEGPGGSDTREIHTYTEVCRWWDRSTYIKYVDEIYVRIYV